MLKHISNSLEWLNSSIVYGSVTPLEWLENLSKVFMKISPLARDRFSRICGALAEANKAVHRAIESGDYEIVTDKMIEEEEKIEFEKEMLLH